MADITKDALRKEIAAILKGADLSDTSAKNVRQELETKLGCKLQARKKEIDELVMDYVSSNSKKKPGAGKKDSEDDDEEEEEEEKEEEEDEEEHSDEDAEESDEYKKPAKRASTGKKPPVKRTKKDSDDSDASEPSDAESEEEYSPKKTKPAKGRKLPPKKKKGGSDSDSDEDWGKSKKPAAKKAGKGNGYTRAMTLSPELAALVGQDSMARHEVVKKMWAIIKERDLYDPKNKQFAICDDALLKVMGVKRFRMFGMMKYLKNHFIS